MTAPTKTKDQALPVLPLRDVVVFPHMVIPLFVGREKSIAALEAAMDDEKRILLVAQRSATEDDPGMKDVYRVGTIANVLQLLRLPDGTVKVLVEGSERAEIEGVKAREGYLEASVRPLGSTARWITTARPNSSTRPSNQLTGSVGEPSRRLFSANNRNSSSTEPSGVTRMPYDSRRLPSIAGAAGSREQRTSARAFFGMRVITCSGSSGSSQRNVT